MKIRLSENFRAVFYAPFYATIALGHYAREGVDVALIPSATPGSATAGLVDGSLDAAWGGPMRVLKARDEAAGPALVAFCEVVTRDPFYLVGGPGAAPVALADLGQMRLATVSEVPTPWLCLQHDLREIGLDPDRLARIGGRTMPENLAALARGEIDIAQLFEPYATQVVASGLGEIVHAASSRGPTCYTTLLATRDGAARNRDAFAAMMRATARTLDWLAAARPDDLAQAVHQDFFPGVERAILAAAFARYLEAGLWSRTPAVSRAGFDRLAQSLASGGIISRIALYEDCVIDPEAA